MGLGLGNLTYPYILRPLGVEPGIAVAVTFLCVFSPFVLFNGASLFPHIMTAVLVMAIVLLLLTRYEVFVLSAVPFVIAGVWRKRGRFVRTMPLMAVGGLPLAVCFMKFASMACSFPGRHVYLWRDTGWLQPVDCSASGASWPQSPQEGAGQAGDEQRAERQR